MSIWSSSLPYSPFFTTSSKLHPTLTKDEIYAFHSIDRKLFTRLVLELRCNKNQSLRVMTLWIWLERASLSSSVVNTILKFPDPKLQAIFDESLLCLKFVDHDSNIAKVSDIEFPLIKSIAKKMDICPKFFFNKKEEVLSGMEKAFNDVCSKAFDDIIEKVSIKKKAKPSGSDDSLVAANGFSKAIDDINENVAMKKKHKPSGRDDNLVIANGVFKAFDDIIENVSMKKNPKPLGNDDNPVIGNGLDLFTMVSDVLNNDEVSVPLPEGAWQTESTIVHSMVHHGSMLNSMQFPPMQDEVVEMLRLMKLNFRKEGEELVPPDDRAIFLTFSIGFPVPAMEVIDFFTRLLGDLSVEEVRMQDVGKDQQPLYAKLVLRDPQAIFKILGRQTKAKFSINGKDIWARKYINKSGKFASTATPGGSAGLAMPFM